MSLATTTALTDRIYGALAERRVDYLPLHRLAHILNTTTAGLCKAVESSPCLGICPGAEPVLYCLPPQPRAAGFDVCRRGGRLVLRLPGRGLRPPMLVGGQHVGRAPRYELSTTCGAGELAYTVCRLTQMALGWMPAVPDPTRFLFELISEAWRNGSTTRFGCGFGLRRASFAQLVATEPMTNRIELVANRHRGSHWLANVYPTPPAQGIPVRGAIR